MCIDVAFTFNGICDTLSAMCVFNATYLDMKYMLGPVSSCVVKYKICDMLRFERCWKCKFW